MALDRRQLLLLAGDITALLVFAAIGRGNHGEGESAVGIVSTALPFIIGWITTAPFTGAFGEDARAADPFKAAPAAAKSWVVATPVGLLLRSVQKGYMAPVPFIIVAMVATGVLLVGWRTVLAANTPPPNRRKRQMSDRKGNPLEFLSLLSSLTKRW